MVVVFMSLPSPDRKVLEEMGRERLRDAKLRLDFAKNYLKEVQKDYSSLAAADGQYALQRAVRAENVALREYNHVLRIYTNLVKGVLPNEDDWPLPNTASSYD